MKYVAQNYGAVLLKLLLMVVNLMYVENVHNMVYLQKNVLQYPEKMLLSRRESQPKHRVPEKRDLRDWIMSLLMAMTRLSVMPDKAAAGHRRNWPQK